MLTAKSLNDSWCRSSSTHYRIVCVLILTSMFTIAPVGYHLDVLNVPEKVIQSAINESMFHQFHWSLTEGELSVLWSVLVASQSVGALLGCFFIVPLCNRHGTKTSMMLINNILLIIGSATMAGAYLFDCSIFLIVGRLLIGIYTGLACALLPIFVQELAPKEIKGALSCFMHMAVCLGATAAGILSLDFVWGGATTWGVLLAFPSVFGIIQMFISFFFPDTPSHLLQNGKTQQALHSIQFYYGIKHENEGNAMSLYNELVTKMPDQISFQEAFKDFKTRRGIFIGMIVSASQIFCGSMAAVSYSTSMFSSVSFMDEVIPYLPAVGSLVSAFLTVPSLHLVESFGRRQLLLSTLSVCLLADYMFLVFSLLSQSVGVDSSAWSVLFAFSFFLYGVGYNLGTGPVAYFIPGELVRPEAASVSLGAAVAVNWFCSMVTTLVYYPLNIAIGGWSYLLFAIPSSVFLAILCRNLPETKQFFFDRCQRLANYPSYVHRQDEYGTFKHEKHVTTMSRTGRDSECDFFIQIYS